MLALDDRRRHVGAAAHHAPGDEVIACFIIAQGNVPFRTRLDGKDRLDRPVATADYQQVATGNGRRNRGFRFFGQPPEFLSRIGVVAPRVL